MKLHCWNCSERSEMNKLHSSRHSFLLINVSLPNKVKATKHRITRSALFYTDPSHRFNAEKSNNRYWTVKIYFAEKLFQ